MALEQKDKSIKAVVTFAQDASSMQSKKTEEAMVLPQKDEDSAPKKSEVHGHKTPFGDLTEVAQKIAVPQESVLSERSGTFDAAAGDGTIIRETKHKRFKLFPAMLQATTEWFVGQKSAYEAYRHPYHPIENADARKEVIKAAVEKSSIAPREDFKAVAEHLKEVPRKPVTTTLTLKDKAEIPKPSWSYVQEETPVSEAPQPQQEETAPPTETIVPREHLQEKTTVPLEKQEPIEEKEIPQYERLPEVAESPIEEVRIPLQERAPEITPPPEAPVVPKEKKAAPVYAQSREPVQGPSYIARYAIAAFLFVSILTGVGVSFYLFRSEETPQEKAVVYKIPSLISVQAQYPLPLSGDREALLQSIAGALSTNGGVIQLYPQTTHDGIEKPATPEEILVALAPRINPSFGRAILELTFGGVQQEPYIIMKTTSFDVAFAGMLQWERTMSADLSPLFGAPVVATFDPSARTDTQVREAFFKDIIANNKNVRLLLDEEGKDRIVYTFVDQNTVLITTTREAQSVLLPLMK